MWLESYSFPLFSAPFFYQQSLLSPSIYLSPLYLGQRQYSKSELDSSDPGHLLIHCICIHFPGLNVYKRNRQKTLNFHSNHMGVGHLITHWCGWLSPLVFVLCEVWKRSRCPCSIHKCVIIIEIMDRRNVLLDQVGLEHAILWDREKHEAVACRSRSKSFS